MRLWGLLLKLTLPYGSMGSMLRFVTSPPEAFAVHFEDVIMLDEPVERRDSQLLQPSASVHLSKGMSPVATAEPRWYRYLKRAYRSSARPLDSGAMPSYHEVAELTKRQSAGCRSPAEDPFGKDG